MRFQIEESNLTALGADLQSRLAVARARLRGTGGVLVAFSGGGDSTLLAALAVAELADRALAVTALSPTYPRQEQDEAAALAVWLGIRHMTVESNELEIPGFADNPPNRCYYCKSELFGLLRRLAAEQGLSCVVDGTNLDDLGDYRPGRQAAGECGVVSPLLEARLTKADVRSVSRALGLPTAAKPALACLASRFPYGTTITPEKLAAVDALEMALRQLGFAVVRVRHHGDVARIEVGPDELPKLLAADVRARVTAAGRTAGFRYVAADLEGYRTGSLNETLGVKGGADAV